MYYWIIFGGILLLLLLSAARGFDLKISQRSFFHFPGERRNFLSLGIADITLGTGVVYVLTASSQNGLIMVSIPLGLLVGYILYARFLEYIASTGFGINQNLFVTIRDKTIVASGLNRSYFDCCVTTPIVLIFLFVFAFELFASGALIAAVVAPENAAYAQIIIVSLLFVASFAASFLGGMQANVRNDQILAIAIALLIALLAIAGVIMEVGEPSELTGKNWLTGVAAPEAALIAALLAFFNGVTTQFYSILNAYTAANFDQASSSRRVMVKVGYTVAVVLLILVLLGALTDIGSAGGALPESVANAFGDSFGSGFLAPIFTAAIVVGMVSIVFSTIDTLMMSLTYFVHRNILNKEIADSGVNATGPRVVLAALFVVGFIPLLGLFATQPNLFYLLLTVATGASVFAPLIVALGFIAVAGIQLPARVGLAVAITFCLFVAAAAWAAYSAVVQPSGLTPFISLIVFGASCVNSFLLWRSNT